MVLALALSKQGIRVYIVIQADGSGTTSRVVSTTASGFSTTSGVTSTNVSGFGATS